MTDLALQKKWEKKLQKYGLGVDQPMTDNSEGELAEVDSIPTSAKHPDHARLRTQMDGSDQFLIGGFEVKAVRSLEREIPEWAINNEKAQQILLTAFPALNKTKAHRAKARRWASVIYLYYRMGLPQQIVMKELGMTKPVFRTMCQRIEAIATTGVPRGKQNATPPPSSVVKGRKGNEAK